MGSLRAFDGSLLVDVVPILRVAIADAAIDYRARALC